LVQKQRLMESQATSPTLINTLKEINIRVRESSLYRAVMGNVTAGIAQKKSIFVNIFFREERLPIAEGWQRSSVPITSESMSDIAEGI
ncbi:hypothetical protein C8J56DRAFT_747057, partial [Mycena floridula]